jgi:group I intron endonuclease
MKYIVYVIENNINHKKYFGVTSQSIKSRWKAHLDKVKSGSLYALHSSIRKYGINNFYMVLLHSGLTPEEAGELERDYIKENNSIVPNGYNMVEGGLGIINWTESMRKSQSEKARIVTLRRYENDGEREKQSALTKKLWQDDVYRRNHARHPGGGSFWKGKKLSEEHVNKLKFAAQKRRKTSKAVNE